MEVLMFGIDSKTQAQLVLLGAFIGLLGIIILIGESSGSSQMDRTRERGRNRNRQDPPRKERFRDRTASIFKKKK